MILFFCALLGGAVSAQTLPDQFTIEGRLFSAGVALSGNADIKFEVVDSSNATCVLYREIHANVDLGTTPATQGIFALKLGAGTTQLFHPARLSAVFANGVKQFGDNNDSNTSNCNFTPLAGSQRLVRMYVSQDSGTSWTYLGPDTAITTSPTAMVAETLQGRDLSGFILTNTSVAHMNQADIESIFSSTNFVKLNALLAGSSSQYMAATPSAAVSFNSQRITNLADPSVGTDAATKNYSDSFIGGKSADTSAVSATAGDGYVLSWDKAAQKWKAVPSGDPTRLALTGGNMSGTINFNSGIGTGINLSGNDLLATGHITMSPLKTLTLGNFTTAQETTLVSTLTAANAGASWFTATKGFTYWDGSSALTPIVKVNGKSGNSITLNANDLGLGTAALQNVGTAAGDIPQLDATSRMPAALLPPTKYSDLVNATGSYMNYMPNNMACTTNQTLKWDGTHWICANDNDSFNGSIAGGDLTGTYPNPTIGPAKIDNTKIADQAITTVKLYSGAAPNQLVGTDQTTGGNLQAFTCASGEVLQYFIGAGWQCKSISTVLGSSYIVNGGNAVGAPISIGTNDNNALSFKANGTTKMTVDTSGNVGIGITAPSALLHVSSSANTASGEKITNSSNGASAASSLYLISDSGSPAGLIKNSSNNTSYGGANSLNLGTIGAEPVSIFTNGAPRLTVTNTGVGIGITNPTANLDVSGPIHLSPTPLGSGVAGSIGIDSLAGNALKWHNGSTWSTVGTGTVTSIVAGVGLKIGAGAANSGASIVDSGTLNIDVGTSPNQIVAVQSGGKLPGLDGSLLTNVNAIQLQSRNVAATSPNDQDVLTWSVSSGNKWIPAPVNVPANSVTTAKLADDSVTSSKLNSVGVATNRLLITDQFDPNIITYAICSTDNQVMAWSSLLGWICQSVGTGDFKSDGSIPMSGSLKMNGNTIYGSSTINGNLTLDSTISPTKGMVLLAPAGGNVGIGTMSPSSTLDVNGTVTATLGLRAGTSSGYPYMRNGNTSGAPGFSFSGQASTGMFNDGTSAMLGFSTGGTERMRIDANGNVGIGTTAPARLLHVNGAARFTPTTTPSTPAAGDIYFDSNASNALKYFDGTGWQTVGTGTGDFMKNGSVAMTGNFIAGGNSILGNNTPNANLNLESTSNAPKGNVNIQPNGGNVGIGTSVPTAVLDVRTTSTSGIVQNILVPSGFATGNIFQILKGASQLFTIDASGNVGIGTTSPLINMTNVIGGAALKGLDVQGYDSDVTLRIMNTGSTATRYPNLNITNYGSANGGQPNINFVSSEGTFAVPSKTIGGDPLGGINAFGNSNLGTSLTPSLGASIIFSAAATFGTNNYPTNIIFNTAVAGQSSVQERMRIASDGKIGIGTNNPASALDVNGDIRATHLTGGGSTNYTITTSNTGVSGIAYLGSANTTSGGLSVTGNDVAMKVVFTRGASAVSGQLVVVRFINPFSVSPICVATGGDSNGGATAIYITSTPNDYSISTAGSSLAWTGTYTWNVHCLQ